MFTPEKELNCWQTTFDGLYDMIESTKAVYKDAYRRFKIRPQHCKCSRIFENIYLQKEASWIGRSFQNWEEAYSGLEQTWDKGMRTYDLIMNQLRSEHIEPPQSLKRKAVWSDDEGDEVCLDRIQTSQPFLRTTKRQHRPGPISVTIMGAIGANSGMDSDKLYYRGAATICLTELLEAAGYRVELWLVQHTRNAYSDGNNLIQCVRVKYGSDPLDIVPFLNLSTGWAFRTIWLRSMWLPEETYVESGSGQIGGLETIKDKVSNDSQVIICDNAFDHSSAVRWIREQIEALK